MKIRCHSRTSALAAVLVAICMLPISSVALGGDNGAAKINASWEFARANRLASAGAITRSIPHYQKVLEAEPDRYPQAYFNLAEVYRFKKECGKAVVLYNAYMGVEKTVGNVADAKKGIAQCTAGKKTGTLTLSAEPKDKVQVTIDGYVISRGGDIPKLTLLPGEYTVAATAKEHLPQSDKLTVKAGADVKHAFTLEKKLFYGQLAIDVDQKGATIKIEAKKLDSPRAASDAITLTSPMAKPKKLATGKYFIEVTKPDYNRWIRNVSVHRDDTTQVDVNMSHALPKAIRE